METTSQITHGHAKFVMQDQSSYICLHSLPWWPEKSLADILSKYKHAIFSCHSVSEPFQHEMEAFNHWNCPISTFIQWVVMSTKREPYGIRYEMPRSSWSRSCPNLQRRKHDIKPCNDWALAMFQGWAHSSTSGNKLGRGGVRTCKDRKNVEIV